VVSAPDARAGALLRLPARRPWHVCMAGLACGLALAESGAVVALAIAVALGAALAALREPQLGAIAATLLLAGAAAGAVRLDTLDAPP
jgi:hypothetical protein